MEPGYKDIEDILKEVASEEGLTFRETNDIWKHQKYYIKKQMDLEGVYVIRIPFLGDLCLNINQFDKEIKGKIRKLYQGTVDKINNLKKHKDYMKGFNSHRKVTGVNRLVRRVVRDYHTDIKNSKERMLHNKCWGIIARYSNGMYKKREKV